VLALDTRVKSLAKLVESNPDDNSTVKVLSDHRRPWSLRPDLVSARFT
jgi:hypothetical protein